MVFNFYEEKRNLEIDGLKTLQFLRLNECHNWNLVCDNTLTALFLSLFYPPRRDTNDLTLPTWQNVFRRCIRNARWIYLAVFIRRRTSKYQKRNANNGH